MSSLESEIWDTERIIVRATHKNGCLDPVKYKWSKAYPRDKTIASIYSSRLNEYEFPGYTFVVLDDNNEFVANNKKIKSLIYKKNIMTDDIFKKNKILSEKCQDAIEIIKVANYLSKLLTSIKSCNWSSLENSSKILEASNDIIEKISKSSIEFNILKRP